MRCNETAGMHQSIVCNESLRASTSIIKVETMTTERNECIDECKESCNDIVPSNLIAASIVEGQ